MDWETSFWLSHFRVLRTGLWPWAPLTSCQDGAGMSCAGGQRTRSSFSLSLSPGLLAKGTQTTIPDAGPKKTSERRT